MKPVLRFVRPVVTAALVTIAACSDQAGTPASPRNYTGLAAKSPPPPPALNVTSTVRDVDGAGNALLTRSDDYNGVGSATYTTINNARSQVEPEGSWKLWLGAQSTRKLYLVLASQGIPAPDGLYSENVEAYSRCFDQNNNVVSILLLGAGASYGNCSFGVDFLSGTKYKLAMGPANAGTGRALVTCTAVVGANCTTWTIEPNANVANAGVANLYHFGHNGSLVLDGVYQESYSVTVAR